MRIPHFTLSVGPSFLSQYICPSRDFLTSPFSIFIEVARALKIVVVPCRGAEQAAKLDEDLLGPLGFSSLAGEFNQAGLDLHRRWSPSAPLPNKTHPVMVHCRGAEQAAKLDEDLMGPLGFNSLSKHTHPITKIQPDKSLPP